MALDIRRWWKSRTPEARQKIKMGSVLVGVLGLTAFFVLATQHHLKLNANVHKTIDSTTSFKPQLKNFSGKDQAAEILSMQKQIHLLRAIVAANNHISQQQLLKDEKDMSAKMLEKLQHEPIMLQEQQNPLEERQLHDLQRELAQTQQQLKALQERPTVVQPSYVPSVPQAKQSQSPGLSFFGTQVAPPSTTPVSTPSSTRPSMAPPKVPSKYLPSSALKLHVSKKHFVKVSTKKSVYLPAGSIITGVTLNGIQAPTGPGSRDNPEIVDIRVKKDAILPNGYRSSIRNCDILASGYGSLSSRSVYLLTNELSCVLDNGGIISSPLKGYIVGSNGMIGVKGTLVSHQAPAIIKSFIAGLFSGLGGDGAPTTTQGLDLNPTDGSTQNYQIPSMGYIGYSAAAGGVETAAGQISKFYLKEAEALQPVIQINPGLSVNIILEYGAHISLVGDTKRQIQRTDYSVSQEMNQNVDNNSAASQPGVVTGTMPPLQQATANPTQTAAMRQRYAQQPATQNAYRPYP